AAPRAAVRAGLCCGHGAIPGAFAGYDARIARPADVRQFPDAFFQGRLMRVRILGCGTSSGVPRVGNDWGSCDPANPKNRRRRVSILVEWEEVRILVDTPPDIREQLLDAEVNDVEAVIWTHDHADHCHGIDDLRQLYHARGRPVAGYARSDTLVSLEHRFAYAFDGKDGYPAVVRPHLLPN